MKLRSITAKFILIVAVLMAMVMALQFYFITQTQQDVLSELNRISNSINTTTDRIFFENLNDSNVFSTFYSDSLDHFAKDILSHQHGIGEFFDEDENVIITESGDLLFQELRKNKRQKIPKADSLLKRTIKGSITWSGKAPYSKKVYKGKPQFKFETFIADSSTTSYEIVEIDINDNKMNIRKTPQGIVSVGSPKIKEDVVSFVFPNLTTPKAPQVLRYNYSTQNIASLINDIRDRNILITLALFALSLIAIAVIAGKFLKPIKSLNQSFDKVVQGDLDVTVESKSNDEIGELSDSFNHMVMELRKNKNKEVLINRQERLASLGQLAAGVAHEIKNPLNAINLTIEHLNDKFINSNEKQAAGYILSIQKEIKRLDKTVNNFLSYLRSESLIKNKVNVNELLDEIFDLYEHEMQINKIVLKKDYQHDFILELDAERFKTVIMNIIINAIQAMASGGEISVKSNKNKKSIIINDTGSGIAAQNLENIFDLFYTTKSAGTGLGLPTAYKIVKEHGGEINIKSAEGQGTEVTIQFFD